MLPTQNSKEPQNNLGVMYANGQGVPQDRVVAYALYNLSAAGDPSSENKATANRNRLAETMGQDEIAAAQALTRQMMQPGKLGQALDDYFNAPAKTRRIGSSAPPARQAASDDPYPPQPAKVPGRVSCSTRCINADCWRTYDNGRKVKFRAKQKWNPFDNRFEWDAGPC